MQPLVRGKDPGLLRQDVSLGIGQGQPVWLFHLLRGLAVLHMEGKARLGRSVVSATHGARWREPEGDCLYIRLRITWDRPWEVNQMAINPPSEGRPLSRTNTSTSAKAAHTMARLAVHRYPSQGRRTRASSPTSGRPPPGGRGSTTSSPARAKSCWTASGRSGRRSTRRCFVGRAALLPPASAAIGRAEAVTPYGIPLHIALLL